MNAIAVGALLSQPPFCCVKHASYLGKHHLCVCMQIGGNSDVCREAPDNDIAGLYMRFHTVTLKLSNRDVLKLFICHIKVPQ